MKVMLHRTQGTSVSRMNFLKKTKFLKEIHQIYLNRRRRHGELYEQIG